MGGKDAINNLRQSLGSNSIADIAGGRSAAEGCSAVAGNSAAAADTAPH